MSQKVQIYKNQNSKSLSFGKYYVRAVYDDHFITTDQLADYIQSQCTVKRSDCKAVLDELGAAMKHYFELGQKIKLANVGIFKVGVSSDASTTKEGCTAANVRRACVIFQPETVSVANGHMKTVPRAAIVDGQAVILEKKMRSYNHPAVMLKDVTFELSKPTDGSGITSDGNNSQEP